jgi:hypothetical protein
VRRHPVSPAVAVRLGVALPQRYAVFGLTAPGPAGTVRTLLAGTPAVWCRTMVYTRRSLGEDRGELRVLFEQTFGEPFGVADSTGTAAVSGNFLEAFLFHEYPPRRRRADREAGRAGAVPAGLIADPVAAMLGAWSTCPEFRDRRWTG